MALLLLLHSRLRRCERPPVFMWVLSCLFDKLLGKLCTFTEEGKQTVPSAGRCFAPSALAERKCHQQISLEPSLPLVFFLVYFISLFSSFSSSFTPHLSSLSRVLSPSSSRHSLALSAVLFPPCWSAAPRTLVENKWDTCQSKKASGGQREMLRQSVSLLFVLP